MARGQTASQGRAARSEGVAIRRRGTVNAIAEMAKGAGIDPSKMSLKEAEAVLIKPNDYPANASDLRDIYEEQAFEMRANDMSPSPYGTWVKDRAAASIFAKQREQRANAMTETEEGRKIETAYQQAVKTADAGIKQEQVARYQFEDAVKAQFGKSLRDVRFELGSKKLKDGTPVNKDNEEQFFKELFPAQYAKLETSIKERDKVVDERRQIADKRRNFLNGREEPKAQEGTGRVARSERPFNSAYNPDTQKIRNQAIIETLERKDLTQAQKAFISSEIAKGSRDKKIGLG